MVIPGVFHDRKLNSLFLTRTEESFTRIISWCVLFITPWFHLLVVCAVLPLIYARWFGFDWNSLPVCVLLLLRVLVLLSHSFSMREMVRRMGGTNSSGATRMAMIEAVHCHRCTLAPGTATYERNPVTAVLHLSIYLSMKCCCLACRNKQFMS